VATGPGHRWRSRGWPPSTAKQRSDTERKLEQARNDRAPRRPPDRHRTGSPSPRAKHRSSWRGCWPRARTMRRASSRDRRVLRAGRAPPRDGHCLAGDRAVPGNDRALVLWPPGDGALAPAGAAHQADRGRRGGDPGDPAPSLARRLLTGTRCTAPCSTRTPTWHRSRAASGCCGHTTRPEHRRQATQATKDPPRARRGCAPRVWSWESTKLRGPCRGVC